jgi:ribosomal protein S18 acetylase RimI-like enzyme
MNSQQYRHVMTFAIICLLVIGLPNFSCQAFHLPVGKRWCAGRTSNYVIPSQLHLFQSLLQKSKASADTNNDKEGILQAAPKSRVPTTELSDLNKGFGVGNVPPFPYSIDLLPKKANDETVSNQATKLVVRHLEEEDIVNILPEVVREFGSLMSSTPNEPGDEVATQIENYLFSLTVLIGLTQRVKRRIKGYPTVETGTKSNYPDHNVICIVEQIPTLSQPGVYTEQIVGIGEISWQPPNPNKNAPPFVLPYFIKRILAKFTPNVDENGNVLDSPRGYISNVLVYKSRRGLGYANILMAALEGIAITWGCKDVRLHVDADEKSGNVAQSLYRKLGYNGVPDRASPKKKSDKLGYEWMGPSMANEGLYMVDGIPLLYMQKPLEVE